MLHSEYVAANLLLRFVIMNSHSDQVHAVLRVPALGAVGLGDAVLERGHLRGSRQRPEVRQHPADRQARRRHSQGQLHSISCIQ